MSEWTRLVSYLWRVAGHAGERPVFGDVRAHQLLQDASLRARARARDGRLPQGVRHVAEAVVREAEALAAFLDTLAPAPGTPAREWHTVEVFVALIKFRWGTGDRPPRDWDATAPVVEALAPEPTMLAAPVRLSKIGEVGAGGFKFILPTGQKVKVGPEQSEMITRLALAPGKPIEIGPEDKHKKSADRLVTKLGELGLVARRDRPGTAHIVLCETPFIVDDVNKTTDVEERTRSVRRLNAEALRDRRRGKL